MVRSTKLVGLGMALVVLFTAMIWLGQQGFFDDVRFNVAPTAKSVQPD